VRPSLPLVTFLFAPSGGTRRQFRSFLSPLAFGGTPLGYSVDKCAARLCFFFAAGAFTGRLDTLTFASKKALLINRKV